MIPIKLQCGCGQKYAFEVEPVNGQMENAIACPICGVDGTSAANEMIALTLVAQPPPLAGGLRTAPTSVRAEAPIRPAMRAVPAVASQAAKQSNNLGLGILGAVIGALVGVGVMYGFYQFAGFRFPLLGVGIGVLTGFGARTLYHGTDNSLGIISGVIALVAVVGTLFLMYGTFPIISIISVAVSVSMAYRIAS
jgi:hypothetical protein